MNGIEIHRRAVEGFAQRVRAIGPDDWTKPTPCSEWDVRALVAHVAMGNLMTRSVCDPLSTAEVALDMNDLPGEIDRTSAIAIAAFDRRGLDGTVVHPAAGEIPAAMFCQFRYTDQLVHAWDLARAIGADETLDPELTAAAADATRPIVPMMAASGFFAPMTDPPAGADPQTELLAMCGRRV